MSMRVAPLACAAVLAAALGVLAAAPARAVVPPRDCDTMREGGKRYAVKAHRLRCPTARRYARRWLESRRRPAGWRCTQPRNTRLKLHCSRGVRVFFVIRR